MDKVSEAFELPVTIEGDNLFDHNGVHCVAVELNGSHRAKAAALAINAYPAMLEALEQIAECPDISSVEAREIAKQAIALAKGEA